MRLYINIDHVATIREARKTDEPDPVIAAALAEQGGADGITVHLREDRRHIQDHDVERLARSVTTPLNLELATSEPIVALACRLRPYQATLVPERREEITTEGGLDIAAGGERLRTTVRRLMDAGIHVSLFIGPDEASIEASVALGVPAVELHTGAFAHAWPHADEPLDALRTAARLAKAAGLHVHAGHGLTYRNVHHVAAIPELEELNIGHSVVARAVMDGMEAAVREMQRLVRGARAT